MSRFFSSRFAELTPYVPGEQPREQVLLKLNTNESPYEPSQSILDWAASHLRPCNLYSDPDNLALRQALAKRYGVNQDEVIVSNGSDEVLNWAFAAFCDEASPAFFADLTYGFYPVFAAANRVPYTELPLKEDFTIDPEDYCGLKGTVFIANPNAPTGIALPRKAIERILQSNTDHVVVIDEAYVDFGAESCVPLIHDYSNLLVTQTFSKSRSFAGGRLGYGMGSREIISDLNTLRNSGNPYNVNNLTTAMGLAILMEDDTTRANCAAVAGCRDATADSLRKMGFEVLPSSTNFLFARHPGISGEALYRALKDRGILIRHFDKPRIQDFNRITIGSAEQMSQFVSAVEQILQSAGRSD